MIVRILYRISTEEYVKRGFMKRKAKDTKEISHYHEGDWSNIAKIVSAFATSSFLNPLN